MEKHEKWKKWKKHEKWKNHQKWKNWKNMKNGKMENFPFLMEREMEWHGWNEFPLYGTFEGQGSYVDQLTVRYRRRPNSRLQEVRAPRRILRATPPAAGPLVDSCGLAC